MQATTTAHVELEERLARWFGYEKCLTFTTGYQAMVGTIMSLADKSTTLILDNLSHACILDGTFLAAGTPTRQPEVRFFNHNSARSLERCLRTKERKNAIVLVEGIYSLDGDEAKIVEIVEVCERYDAVLVLDDAHGTGTLGARGTGIVEKYGLEGRVPIVVEHLLEDVRRHRRDPPRAERRGRARPALRAIVPLQRDAAGAHRRRGRDDPRPCSKTTAQRSSPSSTRRPRTCVGA